MEAPPPPAGCMVRAGACKNGQGGKPGAEGGVGAAAFPGTGAACSDGQAREQDDDGRGSRRVRDTENMYLLLCACDNRRSEGSSNREQQQQRGEQQQ